MSPLRTLLALALAATALSPVGLAAPAAWAQDATPKDGGKFVFVAPYGNSITSLDVTATPLQMAMVAAGIANDGVVMKPRMVDRVVAPDLTVQESFADTELGRALSTTDAATMTSLMIAPASQR